MIQLSYTSLSNLYAGHEWVNKMLGIPVPDYPFLKEGKETHRIIQDHVSGKVKNEFLKHIEINFPIVEEKDFDENCKFIFYPKDGYQVIGYVDGMDAENGRLLEIKTSNKPWSISQFRDSMQRKIYALAHIDYKEAYLITGSKDPNEWEKSPPKLYSLTLNQKDRDEALGWIMKGISILEKGDFSGGLDESKRCTGCFWNMTRYSELANCHFL